jgi:hypothetical protein
MVIWYIFTHFGMLFQDKSGNPVHHLLEKNVVCIEEEVN